MLRWIAGAQDSYPFVEDLMLIPDSDSRILLDLEFFSFRSLTAEAVGDRI